MINLLDIDGFQWDDGNSAKSLLKHNVTKKEAEEVFNNYPLFFGKGSNKGNETRLLAYGKTDNERLLTSVFVIRKNKIRIISSRPQSKNEKKKFNEKSKKAIETDTGI